MSGNSYCFVEWKEQFVSQERGNRVVHYFLKDSVGVTTLAVVGTERSVRHMFYVVSDEFLQAYGKESSVPNGFKWRSRREVVDWLTSMLSKQHLHGDHSESLKYEATKALGSQLLKNGVSFLESDVPEDKVRSARNFSGPSTDIVWSGAAWTCGKQLKHYPAFCRNGTSIAIQSFVFVMAKGENHYLAYVEDMYEDKKGLKKVKVRWFHHNQEVKGIITLRNSHPKEVFITPYAQVISAECVDGPASVLTREHYDKCLDAFPHALLSRVHLCYRQFRSNRLKPFDLTRLHGYFDQPILISCLGLNAIAKPESTFDSLTGEEDEDPGSGDNLKLGVKRMRTSKGSQVFELERSRGSSGKRHHMGMHEPFQKLNCNLLDRKWLPLKHVECWPRSYPLFKVNEKVELLCQDSGIRGCWFRCTVLHLSRKQMRVHYDDLQDEDGCGNLEEWIPTFKMAMPDKLGMRHSGRPTVRPAPPQEQTDHALEIGAAVDAWWSDGWWEGILTGCDDSQNDNMHVYIPGESLFLNVHKKDLRISRDWLGTQWVDIESKRNILSSISAVVGTDAKLSTSSASAQDPNSGSFVTSEVGVTTSSKKLDILEEYKINSTASASPGKLAKDVDDVNCKRQLPIEENGIKDDDVDTKNSCDNMGDVQDHNNDVKADDADDKLLMEACRGVKQKEAVA